jgi:hypothetical protein
LFHQFNVVAPAEGFEAASGTGLYGYRGKSELGKQLTVKGEGAHTNIKASPPAGRIQIG